MMGSMDFMRIATRVSLTQPLSDRPDYGSKDSTVSADLMKFVAPDIQNMQSGLDAIVAKLEKLSKTLPPTSESKSTIDETLIIWKKLKEELELQFEDFVYVEI